MGYQGRSKAKGQRGGAFVGWFCRYHQGGLSLIAGQGAARPGAGGGVEAAAANAKVELLLIAVVLREGVNRERYRVSNDRPTPAG